MKKLLLHTETTIDSAHQLRGYDGNCARIHGHTWHIDVWIKGNPKDKDEVGILFDFSRVKELKDKFDHYFINAISPFDRINPTAENLSMNFYDLLKIGNAHLEICVRVYETKVGKETWCQYGDFEI